MFCAILVSSRSVAQEVISLPYYGIKFTVPQGWVAQEGEDMYILGSHTIPGVIIITEHQYGNLDEIRREAAQGIVDENGTNLKLTSELKPFGKQGLVGDFAGTLEWQQVKARGISLVARANGGVTMLIVTEPQLFSSEHEQAIATLANSFEFSTPKSNPAVSQWKTDLSGCRLSYYNTYSSSDGSDFSGYSDKTVIDLCAQGYFQYSDNSDMSISTGGSSAYSYNNNDGAGTWEVVQDGGEPVLQLKFTNGNISEYALTTNQDGHTLLNGSRFFRTCNPNDSVEAARPNCN